MSYLPEPHTHSINTIDLPNYATKSDLKMQHVSIHQNSLKRLI